MAVGGCRKSVAAGTEDDLDLVVIGSELLDVLLGLRL